MNTLLKNITTIQTGLFAKPNGKGELAYIQVKHFDNQGQLCKALHLDLASNNISDKHILKPGDILFSSKGSKNFAVVYEARNAPAVASTSFFVIRINSIEILPQYLAWYLNNEDTQSKIKGQAIGTSIPSISKHILETLEVSFPRIEIQLSILQIASLRKREKYLANEIERLREIQIQQQIKNLIQK